MKTKIRRVTIALAALTLLCGLSPRDAGAYCMDCRYNPAAKKDRCYFTNWGGSLCGLTPDGTCSTWGNCREPI
jgi:hypothetical protein